MARIASQGQINGNVIHHWNYRIFDGPTLTPKDIKLSVCVCDRGIQLYREEIMQAILSPAVIDSNSVNNSFQYLFHALPQKSIIHVISSYKNKKYDN